MPIAQESSHKAVVRQFHEAMNSGDPERIAQAIDEFVDPDARIRTPLPLQTSGAAALKEVFARLHRVYSDLHVTIEDLIAEGDRVVSRNTVTGTQQGDFMGVVATGKPVRYDEIFVFRFANGRIAETWGVVDLFAQMRQLGVIASPEPPGA